MLTLTRDAADVIRGILDSNDGLPDEGGLRITTGATDGGSSQLDVAIVPGPAEGDQAIDADGARVYVGPQAAEVLDDKVLHAEIESNQVRFTVGRRE